MAGNTWGGSWGENPNSSWGESWGFEGANPPTDAVGEAVLEITAAAVGLAIQPPDQPQIDYGAFRTGPGRRKLTKRRKSLLEELDELQRDVRLLALEMPEERPAVEAAIDRAAYLIDTQAESQALARHIVRMRLILQELEDEEVILLAIS